MGFGCIWVSSEAVQAYEQELIKGSSFGFCYQRSRFASVRGRLRTKATGWPASLACGLGSNQRG